MRFFACSLLLLGLTACSGSKATGPTQICNLNEEDTNSASSVGDSTLNCGPNRSKDSHDVITNPEPEEPA